MPKKVSPGNEAGTGKTIYKGMSLTGFGNTAITTAVDIKDGKIIRLRPLHYDDLRTYHEDPPCTI